MYLNDEIKEVESRIKSINNFAPIYQTENSLIDPKEFIDIGSFDLERTLEMDPEFLDTESEHEHDQSVTSTSARFIGELNVNKLQRWIGELMREERSRPISVQRCISCERDGREICFPGRSHAFWWRFCKEIGLWKDDEIENADSCSSEEI